MPRKLFVCLILLAAVALSGPASALAGGGPSAGDQQYTDPLAGSGRSHTTSTSTASSPTPSPPASPVPSSSGAPPASTATTSASFSSSAAPASSAGAAGPRGPDPGKSLPMTGFNALFGALAGVSLVAAGAYLRRVARRA